MGRRRSLRRYVRTRLRRRLFAWFSATILATALAVAGILGAASRADGTAAATTDRARAWAGELFARDWDPPDTRARFADGLAAALGAGVELASPAGERLHAAGPSCGSRGHELPVRRDGRLLGTARVCFSRPPLRWGWLAALAGALAVVWLASGAVARRIARPLDELSGVVRRLGNGDLSARAQVGCRSPDEIGAVAGAVNDMAARLEAQVNEQRELLATVSHELRTPLARLRVLLELLRTSPSPERLDGLEREIGELDGLVGGLLAQSRAELGLLRPTATSARELATRALERAGLGPEALRVNGEGEDAFLADGGLLVRALGNLLDNARTHGGGAERLELTLGAEAVRFEVLDRGQGVPAGFVPFQKFQRGAGGHADGLGLGLTLVQAAARAHGGEAWLRPREGGGSAAGLEVVRRETAGPGGSVAAAGYEP